MWETWSLKRPEIDKDQRREAEEFEEEFGRAENARLVHFRDRIDNVIKESSQYDDNFFIDSGRLLFGTLVEHAIPAREQFARWVADALGQ